MTVRPHNMHHHAQHAPPPHNMHHLLHCTKQEAVRRRQTRQCSVSAWRRTTGGYMSSLGSPAPMYVTATTLRHAVPHRHGALAHARRAPAQKGCPSRIAIGATALAAKRWAPSRGQLACRISMRCRRRSTTRGMAVLAVCGGACSALGCTRSERVRGPVNANINGGR
jgi:hypothetical protein